MDRDRRDRNREGSLHRAALGDLKRGGKVALIFGGCVFGLLGMFVVFGMVIAQQQIPAPPSGAAGSAVTAAPGAPGAPSPDVAAAWRPRLVSFLELAAGPDRSDAGRWFPGAASETDGFTYTPLSAADPGAGRTDGTARVNHRELSATDVGAVFRAVSRDGTIVPSTLVISSASGTDEDHVLGFTLRDKGGALLTGEAVFRTRESGDPVIVRFVYGR
ncbi:hypothetical protein [Streptomyces sp. AB3(2024)]|uniref:hypothetical protein n=1 Tax=Streptomyces sp. AB3(2024) TaxID=3317321 RepID=UPI0035A39019